MGTARHLIPTISDSSETDVYQELLFALPEAMIAMDANGDPLFLKPAGVSTPVGINFPVTLSDLLSQLPEICKKRILNTLNNSPHASSDNCTFSAHGYCEFAKVRILRAKGATLLLMADSRPRVDGRCEQLSSSDHSESSKPEQAYLYGLKGLGGGANARGREFCRTELDNAIKEGVYERLFVRLRAFNHGENGAMCLSRLALLAENLPYCFGFAEERSLHSDENDANRQPTLQRFIAACEEFESIVYQDLARIASLLILVDDDSTGECQRSDLAYYASRLMEDAGELSCGVHSALNFIEAQAPGSLMRLANVSPTISSSIRRLQETIQNVSGKLAAKFTVLPMLVVESTLRKFTIPASEIQFAVTDDAPGAFAIATIPMLDSVLSILIENSAESVSNVSFGTAKRIAVHVKADPDMVSIEVHDNGPGIPPETWEKVFDRGFSTKKSGRGFGLSYARACLQEYGGDLHLISSNSGACFALQLVRA